jgi:4-hydroxy-tetrahydrodipicolinate reductase
MIKILLSGCNGSMGTVITKIVSDTKRFSIVAGFDIRADVKKNYPVYRKLNECRENPDAIIDFSNPEALGELLDYAVKRSIPIVVATTGLSNQHRSMLLEASGKIPVFFSANMSLGINLLIDLVQKAAKVLGDDFDIEIIEKHHNRKIDAPSGTALYIADSINAVMDNKEQYVFDRHSVRKSRSKNEIGIHAVRGGTIVGEHSVIFAGNDEIIEINHSARSREIFASGALKAAAFIHGKKPGMYDMSDLLG